MSTRPIAATRLVLATTLFLGACQALPAGKLPGPAPKASVKAPVPAASPRADGNGEAPVPVKPSTVGSPIAAGPAALEAAPDTVRLAGTVRLDAAYAVQARVGRVVSNNGGATVAFADAALIANNGAGIISDKGAGLLARWGAGIISDKGSGIISDKGSGIISDKGSGIVANNGGGIISDKGSGYALAQAATPELGEIMPAAGMVVGAVDLRTGTFLPIGQAPDGTPAYAVYTDAAGAYALHLPASRAANVVVVAVPPVEQVDPRLALNLVTAPTGTAAALDEDTALASRFMREFTVGIIASALTAASPDEVIVGEGAANESARLVLRGFLENINVEAAKVGLRDAPRAEAERVARRISDGVLATVVLDEVMITAEASNYWKKPPAPAIATMVEVLRACREAATGKLKADPAFFEKQQYLQIANERRPAADAYRIVKPADIGDFVIREYLVTGLGGTIGIDSVFTSMGVGTTDPTGMNSRRQDIEAGALAIGTAILGALLANKDGAHDEAVAVVRGWKPAP